MTRRVAVDGLKQDTPNLISGTPVLPTESIESDEFKADFNPDEGTVSFQLEDSTPVVMKSPKTRQFLLLESFIKTAEPEYKTESFIAIKLASLCITKFGTLDKVSFDYLLDELEFTDLERLAAAISCFRDKLDAIASKAVR
ncbi:hypothetical protein NIES2100_35070 [Calothrix sp. NIES-2100]|uniref:hypothetical protein n=1 Tax=Calothrix sp. NIES-2100 TaxID=1954172 RepID=UPI000B5E754F|nr:hypothetical protein NIES2100_35070 [Calothrix sp. NIES-2100]